MNIKLMSTKVLKDAVIKEYKLLGLATTKKCPACGEEERLGAKVCFMCAITELARRCMEERSK